MVSSREDPIFIVYVFFIIIKQIIKYKSIGSKQNESYNAIDHLIHATYDD